MITKKLFQFILIAIVALFFQVPTQAATCNKSYTLGFFNGVWNTSGEASESTYKLQDLIGNTYNNEPVKYEPFYNHTGDSVGSNGFQDVAETFIQRANEIDKSGQMGNRFEYFWEFMGSSEPTFLDKLSGFLPNAASLFDSVYTAITTKLVSIVSLFLSNPPTETDYAAHNARLDALATDGEKLMLVGHSQGNLFMNHAYDHILPVVTKDRVAAAHIAPASPTLRGDYVLADIDLVINAMRVQGASSVLANNLSIPFSSTDVTGHTLIGTYLDGTRAGRATIKTMIESAMEKLRCTAKYFRWIGYMCPSTSDTDLEVYIYGSQANANGVIQTELVASDSKIRIPLNAQGQCPIQGWDYRTNVSSYDKNGCMAYTFDDTSGGYHTLDYIAGQTYENGATCTQYKLSAGVYNTLKALE
ncbi:MAG: hypothetical protein Q8R58_10250 [Sulfuricurvum sp.]|nr:hypothetical protein [Sulfuricurvum sp.]